MAVAWAAISIVLAPLPAGAQDAKPPAQPPQKQQPAAKGPGSRPIPETAVERAKLLDNLYAHLATAEDEPTAQSVAESIERVWLTPGSDTINVLMERALQAVNAKNTDLALKLLDAVVDLAPDYAEGWNRRAYVHYTRNNVEQALGDLRRVLALDPNHFKALDGLGQIMREIGQKRAALRAYQQLLTVHPFWSGAKGVVDELERDVGGQGI